MLWRDNRVHTRGTIIHRNVARRAIGEKNNEGDFDGSGHRHTCAISTCNWEQMFQGDRIKKESNIVCCTYVCTWFTLCLVKYIPRGWWK
jgi:hypothetical protein